MCIFILKEGLIQKNVQALIAEMRNIEFPVKIKWGLEVCYFPEHEKLIGDILNSFNGRA